MAISDVLLEGGHTFKTYSTRAESVEGGVQSEDFRADVIYGWSRIKFWLVWTEIYKAFVITSHSNHF